MSAGLPHESLDVYRLAVQVARWVAAAAEVAAVLDLVDLPDGPARQEDLRRICRMLRGLGAS